MGCGSKLVIRYLPHLNATLNAISTALLVCGLLFIKRGRYRAHAAMMLSATVTSALFLAGYLAYHHAVGEQSTRQMTWLPHWLRGVYLAILFPHLLLATVMLPLIATALWRAANRNWPRHRRIASPTIYVWLYVSVTGVVIYWMLYHLFPGMRPSAAG